MTKKVQENLRHLSKGRDLIDQDGDILRIESIVFDNKSQNTTDTYDMGELESLTIYIDPRDTKIEELELIIKRQGEAIQNFSKEQKEPKQRKERVILNAKQVKEMCKYATDHPDVHTAEIADMWEISRSGAGRMLEEAKVRFPKKRQPKVKDENTN